MKEKELQKQLDRIQRSLERKQIIEKAEEVVQKYGVYRETTHRFHVEEKGNFVGEDYLGNKIIIDLHYGWSEFGGKDLSISYITSKICASRVFNISTSPVYENFGTSEARVEDNQIKIGELYIHQYTPGDWEKQLNLIYKNGPKKEKPKVEKSIGRDVDKSKLEDLAARLPIKT